MGIPRFYRWLRNRYPQIRMDLSDKSKQVPVIDNLYLDFNGLIYRCIREFQCFLKNKFDPLSEQQIFEKVYQYTLEIVDQVNPQKMIFIAVDGVAPRAKINQSRDRRFRAGKEKQQFKKFLKDIQLQDKQVFQENSISPGTKFLVDLCERLKQRVMGLVQKEWKHLKVLFSDCLNPGQGEHKIMDFLRVSKQLKIFDQKATHCIYSADADVILLSLSLGISNIVLIREDSMKYSFGFTARCFVRNYKKPLFQYVFVNIIRQYFANQFSECLKALEMKDVQPIINDFILLMAFVGNDFLPTQFCFALKQSHMQALFDSYKFYLMNAKEFINNAGQIDWSKVKLLIQICKNFQAEMLQQRLRNKRSNLNQKQTNLANKQEQDQQNLDEQQVSKFQVTDHKITKGQQFYYNSRFGINDFKNDPAFKNIVLSYIEGLEFYAQYYFKGVPSWSWYYPYHYTPLLTDVYDYISTNKIDVKLQKSQPYDPFMALIMMLPPQSFNLLPKQIEQALRRQDCPLRQYYPNDFKLDKYETVNYNRRALIPFMGQNEVRQFYKQFQRKNYDDKQKFRNKKQNTLLFLKTKELVSATEVVFTNKQSMENLKKSLKDKKNKNNDRERLPSLQIFGNYTVNPKGRIIVTRKYKYQGNPNQLVFFNNFLGIVQETNACDENMKNQFESAYQQFGIIGTCTNYYRVKQVRRIRELGRFSFIKTNREVYVPDFALFKVPKYAYIPEIQSLELKQLYSVDQKIVILNEKHFGYRGVVKELKDSKVIVELNEPSAKTNFRIQESQQQFFTISKVGQILGLLPQIVFAVIDQLIVLPKTNKKWDNDVYPTGVNMGLNIINPKAGQICPQYARCQMKYEDKDPQKIFQHVELSETCVQILKVYVKKFEWLIDYLEQCISEGNYLFQKGIYARHLFSEEGKSPNINLFKEFIKLYQIQVPGKFFSIYSKVADYKSLPQINPTQRINQKIQVPYYQIVSKKQAKMSPPALKSEPQFHYIGDRVIILNSLQTGYIVGIDDDKLYVKIPKREQPQLVSFLDIYNSKWGFYLLKSEGKSWNMEVSYYRPEYYRAAQGLQQ